MRYEKTPQGLGDMLAGVSYGLGAMLPASILMLRWFLSRRGTDIGICAAGTGISAVVFPPILSALIERFSLRACFYFEALVSLLAAGRVFLSSHPGNPEGLRPCPVWNTGGSFFVRKTEALHPAGPFSLGDAVSGRRPDRLNRVARVRTHDAPFTSSDFSGAQAAFSFMPGAIADLTGSYAPVYIVFTLFAIFTLAVVQSTYRLERRSAV